MLLLDPSSRAGMSAHALPKPSVARRNVPPAKATLVYSQEGQ